MKIENSKIVAENKLLKGEIKTINRKIDDLEQINIDNSVEIKGILKSNNENCTANCKKC